MCNSTARLSEAGYITPDRKTCMPSSDTGADFIWHTQKCHPFLDDICSYKYTNVTGKFSLYTSCHVLRNWFNWYWLLFLIWWFFFPVFSIAISSSRDSQCVVCSLCGLDVKLKQFFWGTSSRLSVGPGLGCWKPMTNILQLSFPLIPACQFSLHSRPRALSLIQAKGGGYWGTSST